ncbi:hypothetical protein [Actinomadura atramentaria]|uniref:hypothetical protein n=1 Tax=Actinomadura atramentaria TaxID=1990 RepID=UPI00036167C3|nr:hypothetical protein [Actinomadura atramentaria]
MPARRATAALTAVLLCVPCAAACSPGRGAAPDPAIDRAEAERVLARYGAIARHASATLDGTGLAAVESGPQLMMDLAALTRLRAAGRRPAPVDLRRATYYIPRVSGYPRWFTVGALSRGPGGTVRHALLFAKDRPGAAWLLAADPLPAADVLDRVALDAHGYATAVPPTSTGYPVAPARLGAAHAALLTGGPGAPGAAVLATGPDAVRAHRAVLAGQAALRRRGVRLTTRFVPDRTPAYALRTADGGALVWYVLRRHESYRAARRAKIQVAGDLTGLTPRRSFPNRMAATTLIQYLTKIPPTGARPAAPAVTGEYRRAVAVTGS